MRLEPTPWPEGERVPVGEPIDTFSKGFGLDRALGVRAQGRRVNNSVGVRFVLACV
jgi:hypothetical protein